MTSHAETMEFFSHYFTVPSTWKIHQIQFSVSINKNLKIVLNFLTAMFLAKASLHVKIHKRIGCVSEAFREAFQHISDVVVYPYFPIMIYSHKPLLTFLRNICHIHKKETRESSHNHAKSIDSIWWKMRFLLRFHPTHKRYISHCLSSLLLLVVCIIVMLKLLWSLFEHNSINQVGRKYATGTSCAFGFFSMQTLTIVSRWSRVELLRKKIWMGKFCIFAMRRQYQRFHSVQKSQMW